MGVALAAMLVACGSNVPSASSAPVPLRLGYYPNMTHATAIVGIENGILAEALGSGVDLQLKVFNAGPDVVEAIFTGALDASYVGPNPTINAFIQSHGEAIRIIAGSASGGAALVVKPEITTPQQLAGKTLSSPQRGNTQDVALRAWLAEQGLVTNLEGGGDVSIQPQANGDTLTSFIAGEIDGAWVPEPWASRMVEEGGGSVLVDERELWPDGQFVTVNLIVATTFLEAHPDIVKRLLVAQVTATEFVNTNPEAAQRVVGSAIADLTGSAMSATVLVKAWQNLTFTVDPIASSLATSAAHAKTLGLLESDDLEGIYDLGPLNEVLAEASATPVPGP